LAEPKADRTAAGESAGEDSRGIRAGNGSFTATAAARLRASGPLGWVVFGLGLASAIVLVVAELSNLRHTTVITASCHDLAGPDASKCSATAGQHHSYALLLVALVTLAMAWGAAVGRARAAAVALIALGAAVIVIALAVDRPVTRKVGVLAEDFSGAKEEAGPAITLELIAAGLAIGAGVLGLRRREPEPDS
jgi:hypothetical protein